MNEMDTKEINLCSELLREMQKLEFQESSILTVQGNRHFQSVVSAPPQVQRPGLVLAIQSIFLNGPSVVPGEIRLALNIAQDHQGWLTDLKLVLLPFLKANEASFF